MDQQRDNYKFTPMVIWCSARQVRHYIQSSLEFVHAAVALVLPLGRLGGYYFTNFFEETKLLYYYITGRLEHA